MTTLAYNLARFARSVAIGVITALLIYWTLGNPFSARGQLPTPQVLQLTTDTNGVVIAPTNFWVANSNSIVAIVGTNVAIQSSDLTNALGATANVTFSIPSGTYLSVNTALSCATPNSTIVYTTDGTTPNATNGTVYTAPLVFTNTKTLKAYATSYFRTDSAVTTVGYTITTGAKVYYGRSTNTTLTGSQIESLSYQQKTAGINGTYAINTGSGYYFYAWPVSFDTPVTITGFVINAVPVSMADASVGFTGTSVNGWTAQTVSSSTTTYYLFRSAYPLTGYNVTTLSGSNGLP
jgi:hypothetical protein